MFLYLNRQTIDYMQFKLIHCLEIIPREMVVNPFNSHYANSLLFGTRGFFLFFKTQKNAKQQKGTTSDCSSRKQATG